MKSPNVFVCNPKTIAMIGFSIIVFCMLISFLMVLEQLHVSTALQADLIKEFNQSTLAIDNIKEAIAFQADNARQQLYMLFSMNVLVVLFVAIFCVKKINKAHAVLINKTHDAERRAMHDRLTGILNRAGFEFEISRNNMHGNVLALFDLDAFKIINDTCGHASGDQVLKDVAQIVRNSIRNSDIFARLGGDEFALILPNCNVERAVHICEAIREKIANYSYEFTGRMFHVSTSIGVVDMDSNVAIEAIIAAADKACYSAKHNGKNRVECVALHDEMMKVYTEA